MGTNRYTGAHEEQSALREKEPRRTASHSAREKAAAEKQAAREKAAAEKQAARERAEAEKQAELDRQQAEKRRRAQEKKEKAAQAARKRREAWKSVRLVLIVLLVLAVLAIGGAGYAGYRVSNSQTNLPNVYIEGIPVGGMTREETAQRLIEQGWDKEAGTPLTVELPEGVRFSLDRCEAGAMLTREAATEAAFLYGHSGNWYADLMTYLRANISPAEPAKNLAELNRSYIRGEAEKAVEEFQRKTALQGEPYTVDRENQQLRLIKGAGQMKIDLDSLCTEIEVALKAKQDTVDHKHIDNAEALTPPDFEKIHDALAVEPQDAHWKEDSFEVVEEVIGCRFDVEKALKAWHAAAPGAQVLIPLEILEPEVTAESLRSVLFRDRLGAQTTYYSGSNANRINNINLAVSKIDGIVLMPGQSFSYNETVGQRTPEAGFLEAGAYLNGEVVQEVGGGICQVSSTLYTATLYAQLKITSRECHHFRVDYLPWGQDATVSWPSPDFQFVNNREYPIKIVAYCDNDSRSLTIEIWGTDVDGTYIEITYDRYVFYDDVHTSTVIGWHVYSYAKVYDADGNYLRTYELSPSSYYMHDYEIDWPEEDTGGEGGGEGGGDNGGEGGGDGGGDEAIVIEDP